MTHTYLPEFLGACWCMQPAEHHDHDTGSWGNCPCTQCQFERDNDLFVSLHSWLLLQATEVAFRDGIPYGHGEIPNTFRS